MADIPKVLKDQFEAAMRALLNTPPMPSRDIIEAGSSSRPSIFIAFVTASVRARSSLLN